MSKAKDNSMDFHGMEVEVGELAFKEDGTSTVTQITTRATAVTLNKPFGQITTDDTSLAAGAEAVFVVNNSTVGAKSVPVVAPASGQTAGTSIAVVTAVAAGQFSITLTNIHASTADTGAMVINFFVVNAV